MSEFAMLCEYAGLIVFLSWLGLIVAPATLVAMFVRKMRKAA